MLAGDMVRCSGGAQMRLVDICRGIGRCLLIDLDGRLVERFYYMTHLEPMRTAMRPRSLWPEVTRIDQIEFEREVERAAEARRQQRSTAKTAKKAKKQASRRIKRLRQVAA